MVYIHGGGYYYGYAAQYPPYTLMTKDIVLVVIQYRLGTLGLSVCLACEIICSGLYFDI